LIAGPNGAGKSTLAQKYFAQRIEIVNLDEIAKTLPGNQQLKAGAVALRRRQELLQARISFAIETTLTGRSEVRLLQDAKVNGFKTNLMYVGLRDADQSKWRVVSRVQAGGHPVPERDIMRRYARSITNLHEIIPMADRVWIIDNSDINWRLLATIENHLLKSCRHDLPTWAAQVIETVPA
jgi:predicted ABC-type ATPase